MTITRIGNMYVAERPMLLAKYGETYVMARAMTPKRWEIRRHGIIGIVRVARVKLGKRHVELVPA